MNPIESAAAADLKTLKSRKLSIIDFFEILQLEYICCDLRERIYPKDKDKEYWKNVKEGKKVKIENIANKNGLPTIFDDEDLLDALRKKIFQPEGLPKFIYKDDKQRAAQEFYDMLNYFKRGIDIRAVINGEIVVCKISFHKPYEPSLKAQRLDTKDFVTLEVKKCSRIM